MIQRREEGRGGVEAARRRPRHLPPLAVLRIENRIRPLAILLPHRAPKVTRHLRAQVAAAVASLPERRAVLPARKALGKMKALDPLVAEEAARGQDRDGGRPARVKVPPLALQHRHQVQHPALHLRRAAQPQAGKRRKRHGNRRIEDNRPALHTKTTSNDCES